MRLSKFSISLLVILTLAALARCTALAHGARDESPANRPAHAATMNAGYPEIWAEKLFPHNNHHTLTQ
jgi:hypothetical protein